jgi:glycerophosphoryl diester phosphodiesterase
MKPITVIGHRGAAGLEPENTLRSFRRACDLGVDRIETDVRLTRDGVLVCLHDATLDRTTDGAGKVAEMTLEEIKRYDAGAGETIPTLKEAFEAVRERTVLQIELKGEGVVEPALRELKEMQFAPDEVVFSCFDTGRIRELRSSRTDVTINHLYGEPPSDALEIAEKAGATNIDVNHAHITRELVQSAHLSGMGIYAWTPNDREEMLRLVGLRVDGIITDYPDLLIQILHEKGAR